jgi:cytoplasmic tRNA 2-thiolation protein 1
LFSKDIIYSAEAGFTTRESLKESVQARMPVQATCTRCGYIASNDVCKACVLLEGLNRGLPKLGIGKMSKMRRVHGYADPSLAASSTAANPQIIEK